MLFTWLVHQQELIQEEIDPEYNPRRELVQEVIRGSLRGLVGRHEAYPSPSCLAKGSPVPDHNCVLDLTDTGPPGAGCLVRAGQNQHTKSHPCGGVAFAGQAYSRRSGLLELRDGSLLVQRIHR